MLALGVVFLEESEGLLLAAFDLLQAALVAIVKLKTLQSFAQVRVDVVRVVADSSSGCRLKAIALHADPCLTRLRIALQFLELVLLLAFSVAPQRDRLRLFRLAPGAAVTVAVHRLGFQSLRNRFRDKGAPCVFNGLARRLRRTPIFPELASFLQFV